VCLPLFMFIAVGFSFCKKMKPFMWLIMLVPIFY
jgi:hypothetical protein